MILTPDNEFSAVLDACVLAPMLLCDTLLRCAEEPALFRLMWSSETIPVLRQILEQKYSDGPGIENRLRRMQEAFPEASICVPESMLGACSCVSAVADKYVLAAAIFEKAHVIVTWRTESFSAETLRPYGIDVQNPDQFLSHQYHLDQERVAQILDLQASHLKVSRADLLTRMSNDLPEFAKLARTPRR